MPSALVFRGERDYITYIGLMQDILPSAGVDVWAYCLMPDHVHLVAVPLTATSLARAVGELQRRYAIVAGPPLGRQGPLWHGRFLSCPVDHGYAILLVKYVETDPVRAGLVDSPGDWYWSSAQPHLKKEEDVLVSGKPVEALVENWGDLLREGLDENELDAIRRATRTGRPLGDDAFLLDLEQKLERNLRPRKRGPKPQVSWSFPIIRVPF